MWPSVPSQHPSRPVTCPPRLRAAPGQVGDRSPGDKWGLGEPVLPAKLQWGWVGGTRACLQTRAALLDLHCGCPEPERGPGRLGS